MFSDRQTPKTLRQILSQNCTPSDALVDDLEKAARLVHTPKGRAIVRQGEVCDDFVFIRRGLMRVSHTAGGDGGHDPVRDFGRRLHLAAFLPRARAGGVLAHHRGRRRVWLVSYANMKRILATHHDMLLWMHDLMIEQIYAFEKRYVFFSNKSAEERFVNFLLDRYGELRREPIKYISGIVPLKYIAQYLKITQSTLSRLRKKLAGRSING